MTILRSLRDGDFENCSTTLTATPGTAATTHVSALIGAALGTVYQEDAHRMWRFRNYEHLDIGHSKLVELLVGLGVVTSPPA